MRDLTELLAKALANPQDDGCWLVIADRLTQEDNPLGEYIVLTLRYPHRGLPTLEARRLSQLSGDWQARYAPGAHFVSWHRRGLTLRYPDLQAVLSDAMALRQIELPLELELGKVDDSSPNVCFFDADFRRLVSMTKSVTVENQNHSPGTGEGSHHARRVQVWLVADRCVIFERSFEAEWHTLEFRGGGLFAFEGDRAVDLGFSDAPVTLPVALLGALFVAEDGRLACRVVRGGRGAPFLTTVWDGLGGGELLSQAHTSWRPATKPRSGVASKRLGQLQAELGVVGAGNLYEFYVARLNTDHATHGDKEWIAALPDTPLAELRLLPEHAQSPYMPDEWDWQEGWWYPYSTFRPASPAEQAAHSARVVGG